MRRPIHAALARMCWPHLGQLNLNSFTVRIAYGFRLQRVRRVYSLRRGGQTEIQTSLVPSWRKWLSESAFRSLKLLVASPFSEELLCQLLCYLIVQDFFHGERDDDGWSALKKRSISRAGHRRCGRL